jgi:hypothetical protein
MNIYTVVCKAKGTLTLHASTEFQACKKAQSIWNIRENLKNDAVIGTTRYGTPVAIHAYYVGPAELHDAHVKAFYREHRMKGG